ncbi:MAG: DEAD/DEAH box helicase [Planctomycetota bacterium]
MGFKPFNLDPRLLPGIARAGYVTPTPIQTAAMPSVLEGRDIIATAQTGTGKTAVFVLPILHRLLTTAGARGRARVLIVTPTRELAEQIHESIQELGAGTGMRSATIYGGVGAAPQIRALRSGVEILVACPGRLLDHVGQRNADLSSIEILVIDEADRMLDMGFLPSVREILRHVPAKRQTLLFSATFPSEIEHLAAQALKAPKRIAVGLALPAHTVTHALYPVSHHLKSPLLLALLRQTSTDSVLVFTRTKHRAERLAHQIENAGHRVTSLHSNRSQGQRQSALQGFKGGAYRVMVATDIAARGLDVESISHVVNYDMPDTADAYIHRIGRTGRAERTGDAFTFVTPDDEDMIRTLERVMGQRLPRKTLPGFNYSLAPFSQPVQRYPTHPSSTERGHPTQSSHGREHRPEHGGEHRPARGGEHRPSRGGAHRPAYGGEHRSSHSPHPSHGEERRPAQPSHASHGHEGPRSVHPAHSPHGGKEATRPAHPPRPESGATHPPAHPQHPSHQRPWQRSSNKGRYGGRRG